jgi:hypothetical protein
MGSGDFFFSCFVWRFFFLTKMICVSKQITFLKYSYSLFYGSAGFWTQEAFYCLNHTSSPKKMFLMWGICQHLTLSFPYFSLKALDFGRYWENSPIGWGGLTLQLGRTSETGKSSLIKIISFKKCWNRICMTNLKLVIAMKIKNFPEKDLVQRLPL